MNTTDNKHQHQFTRSKPSATVETCRCGKFRYTENAGPSIIGQVGPIVSAMMKTTDNMQAQIEDLQQTLVETATRCAKAEIQRDAALAALRQVSAILSQPCAIDSHGLKTLQILQGDCAIARQQISAAIAAAESEGQ